jgi:YVTN family beta-propeller protein
MKRSSCFGTMVQMNALTNSSVYRLGILFACLFVTRAGVAIAQEGVTATLPNGREIHPVGTWIPLAPYPFALAVRPDGNQVAVPSIGFPFALNVVDKPSDADPGVRRMPAGEKNDADVEVHAGLTYAPDGSVLYVATGDSGKVRAYSTSNWKVPGEVSLDGLLNGNNYESSFAATLLISADGKTLYALDQGNWRIVVIDSERLQLIGCVPTGAYPFGLAFSPDGKRLYVTNSGLFEYKTVPGADRDRPMGSGLHFPPFGYPSPAARDGAVVEGRQVPGLGDENSDRGSSLWTYDISDRAHPVITARLRLGERVSVADSGTIGGAAPTGVAAGPDAVFVSLAHDDAVVKISADGKRVASKAELSPFDLGQFHDEAGRPLRGVMPSGIAMHDGRVYVAESGINAVGVLDAATMKVIEHIPVGWNPSAVDFSPDGKLLYVVNTKGKGAGPNGGPLHDPNRPSYIGSLELGSLSVIPLMSLPAPESLTQTVVAGNTAAIAGRVVLPRLKHCFLVIRENRTFDEVLGDVSGANGDASLARYGMEGWVTENESRRKKEPSRRGEAKALTNLRITPNLHALAQRFAMSDNFYVDSDVSADGHRWVVGINPTPFFNTAWTSNYGGRRHDDAFAAQPGRRALFGGADAPMPEDEPQFGSLWEHIASGGNGSPGILNYGEGLEIEGNNEMDGAAPEGQRLFLNAPVPKPVFESTDRRYPTFNLGIPDQFRVTEFERDFRRKLAEGKVPGLIVIRLPGDHTADPRPEDGYPYRASYVADNDLALGRIIAFLSKTPIWNESAVFVTEDDAQGGVDHVDAHRSVLMIASPWAKPGSISHEHTSMGSITRTIDKLLGLGALNLEDALAGDIAGIWDDHPHLEAFAYLASDPRVFAPAKARLARPKTKEQAAELLDVDDAVEIRKQVERSAHQLRRPKQHD